MGLVSDTVEFDEYEINRVNAVSYIDEDVDDIIEVDQRVGKIEDFDKSEDGYRYFSLSIIPEDDEYENQIHIQREWKNDGVIFAHALWRDWRFAVGSYLFRLDQHRLNPWEKLVELQQHPSDFVVQKLENYIQWVSELSQSERRELWLKLTKGQLNIFDSETDWMLLQWNKIIDKGEWRSLGINEEVTEPALDALEEVNHDPVSCYYTVHQVYQQLLDWGYDVTYCEGIVLPEFVSQPTDHAWVELDGKVIEVVWPSHIPDGGEAVYYGVPVDHGVYSKRLQRREPSTTMLLNDEEYALRKQLIASKAQEHGLDLSEFFADLG